uniref:Uncharacterized protein n=1 Tax=Psilocybe cubensis TaxID=181762 RepID=A0A8H7XRJ8_PSICU
MLRHRRATRLYQHREEPSSVFSALHDGQILPSQPFTANSADLLIDACLLGSRPNSAFSPQPLHFESAFAASTRIVLEVSPFTALFRLTQTNDPQGTDAYGLLDALDGGVYLLQVMKVIRRTFHPIAYGLTSDEAVFS